MYRRETLRRLVVLAGGLAGSLARGAELAAAGSADCGAGPCVRLALNENPFGPSPLVTAALQKEFGRLFRYTEAEADDLVGAVAAHEDVAREQVVLGELLEPLGAYLATAGAPGGEFLYSDPGYTALIDTAVAAGGRSIAVPLDDRMQNDIAGIRSRLGPQTRAVFLVNPHNPTGIAAEPGPWREFAREVAQRALLIVDEAYLEFADRFPERSLVDLVRAGENVIVFRTFAKAYGLAGLDMGYALMPASLGRAVAERGAANPHLLNRLAVAAAAASLRDPAHLAFVVAAVAREREIWLAWLKGRGLRHTASRANFIFFETGIEHARFAAAMRARGVLIGRAFPPYERWARVSIGLPRENERARAVAARILDGAA